MGERDEDLLALAATLRRALGELARMPAESRARITWLGAIERRATAWIETVERLERDGAGVDTTALKATLAELRRTAGDSSLPLARPHASGNPEA